MAFYFAGSDNSLPTTAPHFSHSQSFVSALNLTIPHLGHFLDTIFYFHLPSAHLSRFLLSGIPSGNNRHASKTDNIATEKPSPILSPNRKPSTTGLTSFLFLRFNVCLPNAPEKLPPPSSQKLCIFLPMFSGSCSLWPSPYDLSAPLIPLPYMLENFVPIPLPPEAP